MSAKGPVLIRSLMEGRGRIEGQERVEGRERVYSREGERLEQLFEQRCDALRERVDRGSLAVASACCSQ